MKRSAISCLTLLLSLCFADISLAHGVHVFAFVDGDAVRVEGSFSKSRKVKNGALVVTDRETGALLLEGTTNDHGIFRFRPDADFLKTGHGVRVVLNAGEGHQGEGEILAEAIAALALPEQSAMGVAEDMVPALPAMNPAELEALIGKVMDAKLAPIKQALARQEARGPDLRDIVGGIGWIIGLLGLAAYLRYRPSAQKK